MTAAAMRFKRTPPAPVVATKLTLEDWGQDFLEWDLDADGKVVSCRPFQAWLWIGAQVLNHRSLRVGRCPELLTKTGEEMTLKYPAKGVMRLGQVQPRAERRVS